MTLEQAAELALQGNSRGIERETVHRAGARWLRACSEKRLRASTVGYYGQEVGLFGAHVGGRHVCDLRRADVRGYVESRPIGSRPSAFAAVRAFLRWAWKQDPPLIASDVCAGLAYSRPKAEAGVSVLAPEQVELALRAADKGRSALAVAFFAGLRPEEIAGTAKPWLRWEHVRADEQIIRVPAEIAKTRRARVLEGLPLAVWAWLEPSKREGDTVAPFAWNWIARRAKRACGLDRWPRDGTRHSFASYAVALTSDVGQVSLWLGHEGSPAMLHRHYRGVVSRLDAAAFFALRP